MFKQLLFIDGKCYGELSRKHELVGGTLQKPYSLAFYCRTCGDLWCRARVLGDKTQWMAYAVACRKHPEWSFQPGGTIYLPWLTDFCEALTEGALRRELDLWWNFTQGTENDHF